MLAFVDLGLRLISDSFGRNNRGAMNLSAPEKWGELP